MILLLSRPFCIAAYYLHLLGLNRLLIIELEVDVLDQKRPDLVAETISIEMALEMRLWLARCTSQPCLEWHYFEVQSRLDLIGQYLSDSFVERSDDLHGQLRLDATIMDKVIESIDEGQANAAKAKGQ